MSWVPGKVVHFAPSALGHKTACGQVIDDLSPEKEIWTASRFDSDDISCPRCKAEIVERILTRPNR